MGFDLLKWFYVSLSHSQIGKELNSQLHVIPTENKNKTARGLSRYKHGTYMLCYVNGLLLKHSNIYTNIHIVHSSSTQYFIFIVIHFGFFKNVLSTLKLFQNSFQTIFEGLFSHFWWFPSLRSQMYYIQILVFRVAGVSLTKIFLSIHY